MVIIVIFSSLTLEREVMELCSASLTSFSAAVIIKHPVTMPWESGSSLINQLLK